MISRKGKVPAEQLTKLRDLFLRRQFPKVSSKLDLNTSGVEYSQLQKPSLDFPIQQSKDTTNASTALEEDSRVLPAIEDKKQLKKMAQTIDHNDESSARIRRIYNRASNGHLSPEHSPAAQKKEQIKQLKLNVSAIANKIKVREQIPKRKTYALSPSPERSSGILLNQSMDYGKASIVLPSIEKGGVLEGTPSNINSDLKNRQAQDDGVLAISKDQQSLTRPNRQVRNISDKDFLPITGSLTSTNPLGSYNTSLLAKPSLFEPSRPHPSAKSTFESLEHRGVINRTKIVVQFNGSPLNVLQQQKLFEYRLRVLMANERNIYKHHSKYWTHRGR